MARTPSTITVQLVMAPEVLTMATVTALHRRGHIVAVVTRAIRDHADRLPRSRPRRPARADRPVAQARGPPGRQLRPGALARRPRRRPRCPPAGDPVTHTVSRKRRARHARELNSLRQPAVCPTCQHGRGRHRVLVGGRGGPCLAPGCSCPEYRGPWPVHHLHVTDRRCGTCGVLGSHWAVTDGRKVLRAPRIADLPGETDL